MHQQHADPLPESHADRLFRGLVLLSLSVGSIVAHAAHIFKTSILSHARPTARPLFPELDIKTVSWPAQQRFGHLQTDTSQSSLQSAASMKVGIDGPHGRLFEIGSDALPSGLAAASAAVKIGRDVKQVFLGTYTDSTVNFAVSMAIRDTMMWAMRLITMLFMRFTMKTHITALVDWRSAAALVLGLDQSASIKANMRGLLLATCDVETADFDLTFENPPDITELVACMFTRIVLFDEVIWDFSNNSVNEATSQLLAAIGSDTLVMPIEHTQLLFVPFVATNVDSFTTSIHSTSVPVFFVRELAQIHSTRMTSYATIGAFPDPRSPVLNITYFARMIHVICNSARNPEEKVQFHTAIARLALNEIRPAPGSTSDLLHRLIRSAIFWRSVSSEFPLNLGDSPKVCAALYVRSSYYMCIKDAFDACKRFAGSAIDVFEPGPAVYIADIADVYIGLISSWSADAEQLVKAAGNADQSQLKFACMIVLACIANTTNSPRDVRDAAVKLAVQIAKVLSDVVKRVVDSLPEGDWSNWNDSVQMPTEADVDTCRAAICRVYYNDKTDMQLCDLIRESAQVLMHSFAVPVHTAADQESS